MYIWNLIVAGGFAMIPLLLCSIASWVVILERLWVYRRLGRDLRSFQLEAVNALLRGDRAGLRSLCQRQLQVPLAQLVLEGLEKTAAKDVRVRERWAEAMERRRLLVNQELRRGLWILGTIGSASPFIGLFGTVVGILRSFQEMARTGSGGFAVVAAGISESLIATAAGIVVAVIAVMAFNAFQVRWNALVLQIKLSIEEISEILLEDGNGT